MQLEISSVWEEELDIKYKKCITCYNDVRRKLLGGPCATL
jgi:hypothetical protein